MGIYGLFCIETENEMCSSNLSFGSNLKIQGLGNWNKQFSFQVLLSCSETKYNFYELIFRIANSLLSKS